MKFPEAISRLKRQREYLSTRIEQRLAKGLPFHHQQLDQEAIDIALSAIEYTQAMQDYEASLLKEKDSA